MTRPHPAMRRAGRGLHAACSSRLSAFAVSDLLAVAAIVLYGLFIHRIPVSEIGQYGLMPALSFYVYIAIGLLLLASALALASRTLVVARLTGYLVILIFFLYGTAALVYREGRYNWLYKTVGVVQYINAHGALNRFIDIYQNWPGFFALAAWFDRVAGISNPLGYAKWAQFAFELLTVSVVSFVLKAFPITDRERWTALFLYIAANWVGQDYFSPQALGVVLSLGVTGIALHALVRTGRPNAVGRCAQRCIDHVALVRLLRRGRHSSGSTEPEQMEVGTSELSNARTLGVLIVLFLVYFVLVFSHELSPYLVLAELGLLALVGSLRPSWTIVGLAAIAVGYLIPRFTFVNQHYGLLASLGSFFSNVRPAAAGYLGAIAPGIHTSFLAAEVLSVGMWALGALGAWVRWRSGRSTLVLVLLTVAPIFVIIGQTYGQTAILRVYLFSLPWVTALCASAIWYLFSRVLWVRVVQMTALLVCVVTLFASAFYGADQLYVMPAGEVETMQHFYTDALPGPVYSLNLNFPGLVTSNYNYFPENYLTGPYGVMKLSAIRRRSGKAVAHALRKAGATRGHPAYIVLATTEKVYGIDQGVMGPNAYTDLLHSLLSDQRQWRIVVRQHGVLIEQLAPFTRG